MAKAMVALNRIEWHDTRTQLRIDKRQDIIDGWVEMLKELDEHARDTAKSIGGPVKFDHPFPPIKTFTDGSINGTHHVADGFHRAHTYRIGGRDAIPADVTVCSDPQFEAFKYALSANARHGIPRTNADKRNAVRQALACEQFQGMSLREIAKLCDVNHVTVKNIMDEDSGKKKTTTGNVGVYLNTPHEADTPSPAPPSTRVSTPREHDPPRTSDPVRLADPPTDEEPEAAPTNPLDKLKREVPTGLVAKHAAGKRMAEWRSTLNRLIKESSEESVTKDGPVDGFEFLVWEELQNFVLYLKNASDALKNSEYHTDCPDCDAGKAGGKKCKTCQGAGFLTGSMYERLPPKSKEKLTA